MTQTIFEFAKIAEPVQWLLVAAGAVVLLAFVRLVYHKDGVEMPTFMTWFISILRGLVILLLIWVFLEPVKRTEQSVVRHARTLLLFDVSQSMSIQDRKATGEAGEARSKILLQSITKNGFLKKLREKNDVIAYRFGRNLEPIASFRRIEKDKPNEEKPETPEPEVNWQDALTPDSGETRIGESLAALLRKEANVPLAAAVVFSDGQSNAGLAIEAALEKAVQKQVAVHVVPFGSDAPPQNLSLAKLQGPERAYLEDSFPITAYIQGVGYPGRTLEVELMRKKESDEGEAELIDTEPVTFKDDEPTSVTFQQQLDEAGKYLYTVRIPIQENELIKEDNSQSTSVSVIDRKTKVLLFAGGPTREYQFCRIVLFRDKTIEVSIFLQTLMPGAHQEADHLLDSFPEPKKLLEYDVIIALDPDFSRLSEEQITALRDWVFREGGGFVAIAGRHHTPSLVRIRELNKIRELYPVTFGSDLEIVDLIERDAKEAWALEFTEEGKTAEAIRIHDESEISREAWQTFPGVYRCFPTKQEKPGGMVLARFSDPRTQSELGLPIYMAEQFYGSGRCFYIGSGESWRLRRIDEKYYTRLWVGLVRHIAQGRMLRGSSRGFIMLEKESFSVGGTARIRANLRDNQLQPLLASEVNLQIISPSNNKSELVMKPDKNRPGWFIGEIRIRESGIHRLTLWIPGSQEKLEKTLTASAPDLEFEDPRRNDELLNTLAEKTEGQRFEPKNLASLAEIIPDRSEVEIVSGIPITLWDRTWVMFTAVALLCLEWIIRKRYHLA